MTDSRDAHSVGHKAFGFINIRLHITTYVLIRGTLKILTSPTEKTCFSIFYHFYYIRGGYFRMSGYEYVDMVLIPYLDVSYYESFFFRHFV